MGFVPAFGVVTIQAKVNVYCLKLRQVNPDQPQLILLLNFLVSFDLVQDHFHNFLFLHFSKLGFYSIGN